MFSPQNVDPICLSPERLNPKPEEVEAQSKKHPPHNLAAGTLVLGFRFRKSMASSGKWKACQTLSYK